MLTLLLLALLSSPVLAGSSAAHQVIVIITKPPEEQGLPLPKPEDIEDVLPPLPPVEEVDNALRTLPQEPPQELPQPLPPGLVVEDPEYARTNNPTPLPRRIRGQPKVSVEVGTYEYQYYDEQLGEVVTETRVISAGRRDPNTVVYTVAAQ